MESTIKPLFLALVLDFCLIYLNNDISFIFIKDLSIRVNLVCFQDSQTSIMALRFNT
jgi:hypothetical protein